eukprot:gene9775-20332_t
MGKVKAHELRSKTKSELLKQLDEFRQELSSLRVAKVTNGAASKLAKIGEVRKSIARVLTVYNQQTKSKLREKFTGQKSMPIDLRQKKTRAIRLRLTPAQLSKKTLKQTKKDNYFPQRKYAVKALGFHKKFSQLYFTTRNILQKLKFNLSPKILTIILNFHLIGSSLACFLISWQDGCWGSLIWRLLVVDSVVLVVDVTYPDDFGPGDVVKENMDKTIAMIQLELQSFKANRRPLEIKR